MNQENRHNKFVEKMDKANCIIIYYSVALVIFNLVVLYFTPFDFWAFVILVPSVLGGSCFMFAHSISMAFEAVQELNPNKMAE